MYLTWPIHALNEGRKVYVNLKTNSLAKISLRNCLSSLIPVLKNIVLRKHSIFFWPRALSSPAGSCTDGDRLEQHRGFLAFSLPLTKLPVSSAADKGDWVRKVLKPCIRDPLSILMNSITSSQNSIFKWIKENTCNYKKKELHKMLKIILNMI